MTEEKWRVRELKVVLDTSVIYNASGGELLRDEVSKLIKNSSKHSDLIVTWHLPEVVRNEREHQLRELALESLSAIQKLERVLGVNLGVTEEIVIERVTERVQGHINDLQLHILSIDTSEVDWNKMIRDAAFREPPFSPGKNEKGFRDALIAAAVDQLIASSPDCRLAIVTGDTLLTAAIGKTANALTNVHLVSSIEELKGFINTLVSNVDEAFIQKINAAAATFFFEPGNRKSYLYKHEIKETILKEFHPLIYAVPTDANEVEREKTLVSRPRFKNKVDDRMYWVSRIAFRMKAYNDSSSSVVSIGGYSGYSGYSEFAGYSPITEDSSTSDIESAELSGTIRLGPPVYKVSRLPMKTGYVSFDVTWSVTISPQHQLTDPRLESIYHVETSWE